MSDNAHNKRRLILARTDRIGDTVVSSSCFEPVKRALPEVDIYLLAQARMAPLYRGHPALAGFIPVPKLETAVQRMEALAVSLRQVGADCFVIFEPDPEAEWAAAAAEIPRRIGFRKTGDKWLTESLPYEKDRGEKHEGYYNFDLLELLGVPPPEKLVSKLALQREALDRLADKLPPSLLTHPYTVLDVGAHEGKPRLDPEFFIAVARWLILERKFYVVLVGADHDDPGVLQIVAGLGNAAAWVFNFCGQTDLAESAWLLREAKLVFGRDSGPAHIAAAMGARTVSIMLESELTNSARRWTPLGEKSWVLDKPLRRRLLESRPGFAKRNLRQFNHEEIIAALDYALDA